MKFDSSNLNCNGEVPKNLLNKKIFLLLKGTDGYFTFSEELPIKV